MGEENIPIRAATTCCEGTRCMTWRRNKKLRRDWTRDCNLYVIVELVRATYAPRTRRVLGEYSASTRRVRGAYEVRAMCVCVPGV